MDVNNDRQRRQQKIWRKTAVSILSLHHNLAILMAFLMIIVLGTFWLVVDYKLEQYLLLNTRSYGYGIARYASTDLKRLLVADDRNAQQDYLRRLTDDPLIIEAHLFDGLGTLLAKSAIVDTSIIETKNSAYLTQKNSLTLLVDISTNGQRIGIIQLQIDRNLQEAPLHWLLNRIAIVTLLMMLVVSSFAWFATKYLTNPIRKLLNLRLNTPHNDMVEQSGLQQLLAADPIAQNGEVITLKLFLPELTGRLNSENGSLKIHLIKQLDRLLIATIYSQQGHLLNFDGITAQACFPVDGSISSSIHRAVSCSLLLQLLIEDLSLRTTISLRKEQRLLIPHKKRNSVAIQTDTNEEEPEIFNTTDETWLYLHNSICHDQQLLQLMQLTKVAQNWMSIKEIHQTGQSMLNRKLDWLRYQLSNLEKSAP